MNILRRAGAAAVALTALGASPATAAPDEAAPDVSFNPSMRYTVGGTLSTNLSTATAPVTVFWKQFDESGICERSAELYQDGGSSYPYVAPSATSMPLALKSGSYGSLTLHSTDCASPSNSGSDYKSWSGMLAQEGAFTLGAGWKSQMCRCWSGGGTVASTRVGASASYRVHASSIGLVSVYGPGRGKADIYVDGVLVTSNLDLNRSAGTNRVIAFQRQFRLGYHTIRVVSKTTAKVEIDGLVSSS